MQKKISLTVKDPEQLERFQIMTIKKKGTVHKQSDLIWEILEERMNAEGY